MISKSFLQSCFSFSGVSFSNYLVRILGGPVSNKRFQFGLRFGQFHYVQLKTISFSTTQIDFSSYSSYGNLEISKKMANNSNELLKAYLLQC